MNTFYQNIRHAFEAMAPANASPEARRAGTAQFVSHMRTQLGLRHSPLGRPVLEVGSQNLRPDEFSLGGLANAMLGEAWHEALAAASARSPLQVFESGNAALTPGNIPNVSAYLGTVTGLLDAKVLEGYQKPEFIIDRLIHTMPSSTRQTKLIGLGRIGDQSKERNPGDPHPFANFGERYVVTSETKQRALAIGVTYEMVQFDQTALVLQQANTVGYELAMNKELEGFRLIAGVRNPYNYNGVNYNTYGTSGNWINQIAANPLNDWTALDVSNAVASRLTDQETGNRIGVTFDKILCSPAKVWTAKHIQQATEIETQTQTGTQVRRGAYLGDTYELISSVYLDQVLTASVANGGLNLNQSTADGYWWKLKTGPQGAFVRTENWGLDVKQAAADDFTMLNHKLVLAVFANQMHAFDVLEPRHVQENLPS